MNIYLLWQNTVCGYDTYDSAVVIAGNEESAKMIHPYSASTGKLERLEDHNCGTWPTSPADVKTKLLGQAAPGSESGCVLASFNAG